MPHVPLPSSRFPLTLHRRRQRIVVVRLDRRLADHHRAERLVHLRIGRGFVLTCRIQVVPDADCENVLIVREQQLVPESVLLFQNWKHVISEYRMELFVLVRRDVEANAARDLPFVDLLHFASPKHPAGIRRSCVARIYHRTATREA